MKDLLNKLRTNLLEKLPPRISESLKESIEHGERNEFTQSLQSLSDSVFLLLKDEYYIPTVYTYGYDASKLRRYAWYDYNSGGITHLVGQKMPNSLKLYDMIGNVWEWCEDYYDREYYENSPKNDPKGPASGINRVLRGGSWSSRTRDCRISDRYLEDPDDENYDCGFRILLPIP